jgi:hypothetical protein
MPTPVSEKAAEGQQDEQRQKEQVPAAGDKYDSGEHQAPQDEAHGLQRSSV